MKFRNILALAFAAVLFTGCGEYQKALKSTDYDYKLDFARRAFENQKYVQAYTIRTDIVQLFKGTEKAEESL